MNRRMLVTLSLGFGLVAGVVVTVSLMRSRKEPPPVEPRAETRAPRPAVKEAPKADVLASEPAPRPVRRRPESKPEPAPAAPPPAPAPMAADTAVLHIDSDVPGAHVFIDRQFIGAAPATAPNVKPGTHRLNVSAEGYDGIADTIEVAPGARDILVRLKEVRLDSKIDVVHKHRFGSCEGTLLATPQGLRYETADKDDRFSSRLQDLETFQVDYLQKNLRVKPRRGKQYDFTDPEGNADRLFVFQRDVQKARDRLEKGDAPAGQ